MIEDEPPDPIVIRFLCAECEMFSAPGGSYLVKEFRGHDGGSLWRVEKLHDTPNPIEFRDSGLPGNTGTARH